jgi:hypothetical protein
MPSTTIYEGDTVTCAAGKKEGATPSYYDKFKNMFSFSAPVESKGAEPAPLIRQSGGGSKKRTKTSKKKQKKRNTNKRRTFGWF